jgi:hypothetical protein
VHAHSGHGAGSNKLGNLCFDIRTDTYSTILLGTNMDRNYT